MKRLYLVRREQDPEWICVMAKNPKAAVMSVAVDLTPRDHLCDVLVVAVPEDGKKLSRLATWCYNVALKRKFSYATRQRR